jgi:hypothetical protein
MKAAPHDLASDTLISRGAGRRHAGKRGPGGVKARPLWQSSALLPAVVFILAAAGAATSAATSAPTSTAAGSTFLPLCLSKPLPRLEPKLLCNNQITFDSENFWLA